MRQIKNGAVHPLYILTGAMKPAQQNFKAQRAYSLFLTDNLTPGPAMH